VVVLFLMFFVRPPIENMRQGFDVAFQIGAMLILAAFTFSYVNVWAGAFLAWVVIGSFVSALLYSDFKILYSGQSIAAIQAITSGVIIYVVIVLVRPAEAWVSNMFCILLCIHLFCQLAQFITSSANVGIMYNPNDAGTFAALCSVFFYRKGWAWFWFIPVTSVIYAKSFGGVVGISLGFVVFCFMQNYKIGLGAVVVVTLCGIAFVKLIHFPSTNRFGAWKFGIAFAFDNLWTVGVGAGNWKVYFNKLYSMGYLTEPARKTWIRLHNTWVEGFVEMGVPFAFLCAGYVIDKARKSASLIGIAVIIGVGMSNSFFKLNQLNGVVAIVLLAMLEVRSGRRSEGLI